MQPWLVGRLHIDGDTQPGATLSLDFMDYRTGLPISSPLKRSTQRLLLLPLRLLLHLVIPPDLSDVAHVDPIVYDELVYKRNRLSDGLQAVQTAISIQQHQQMHNDLQFDQTVDEA